ncbi:MAG: FtsX-like permease family protein [Acidimicrobiales bacterium]
MSGLPVRTAWYRFRASFRRRLSGYVSVVLLVGLVGGLALASLAGARRTDSSFAVYLASTHPSTAGVISRYNDPELGLDTGYNAALVRKIAHLPLVERSANAVIFDGNIDLTSIRGVHYHVGAGEEPPTFLGSFDGEYTSMDRVTLLAGRTMTPSSRNEALMNAQAAKELGLHIGSMIRIPLYTDVAVNSPKAFKPFLIAKVTIVGKFEASSDVVESDISALGSSAIIFSPGLTRELAPKCSTGTETFFVTKEGDAGAKQVLKGLYKIDPVAEHFQSELTSNFLPVAQQSISPEAIALAVFGGVAALAALLIAGLMIGRLLRLGAGELDTLRALGASPTMMLVDELLGILFALVLGSLLAVVVAVLLSPLAPLGAVRSVYPDRGFAFDWTVLAFGFVVLVVGLGVLAVLLAQREVRATSQRRSREGEREARLVRSVANSGLPIAAVTGIRFALEPGRGRSATPVRSAALGAVLAVCALVATVTFGASLDSLISHPSLYGWNWDYALLSSFGGAEDLPGPQITKLLDQDHDILHWSGAYVARSAIDGERIPALVEDPGASVQPPVLTGHGLMAANQIVLGAATLDALHVRIGDLVTFDNGTSKPSMLRVVGTMTMPAMGQDTGLGQGALVATSDFPTALLNLQNAPIPGPNAILVRMRPGIAPSLARQSLEDVNAAVNRNPASQGLGGGVVTVLRPAEIVNFRSMGTIPAVLASGLAVGAVAALGLTLVTSVRRRRRDLALLKSMGFTQRQLAASIAWQSSVAALIGCVVGIPLGVLVGRALWLSFARSINVVPAPAVPALTLVLIGVGALVFANLVAAIPGRIAARTSTALVLRAE